MLFVLYDKLLNILEGFLDLSVVKTWPVEKKRKQNAKFTTHCNMFVTRKLSSQYQWLKIALRRGVRKGALQQKFLTVAVRRSSSGRLRNASISTHQQQLRQQIRKFSANQANGITKNKPTRTKMEWPDPDVINAPNYVIRISLAFGTVFGILYYALGLSDRAKKAKFDTDVDAPTIPTIDLVSMIYYCLYIHFYTLIDIYLFAIYVYNHYDI